MKGPLAGGWGKLWLGKAAKEQIPAAEMERMMKAQEVILKAAAGKLKRWEAAEIMGVTDRRCDAGENGWTNTATALIGS